MLLEVILKKRNEQEKIEKSLKIERELREKEINKITELIMKLITKKSLIQRSPTLRNKTQKKLKKF